MRTLHSLAPALANRTGTAPASASRGKGVTGVGTLQGVGVGTLVGGGVSGGFSLGVADRGGGFGLGVADDDGGHRFGLGVVENDGVRASKAAKMSRKEESKPSIKAKTKVKGVSKEKSNNNKNKAKTVTSTTAQVSEDDKPKKQAKTNVTPKPNARLDARADAKDTHAPDTAAAESEPPSRSACLTCSKCHLPPLVPLASPRVHARPSPRTPFPASS